MQPSHKKKPTAPAPPAGFLQHPDQQPPDYNSVTKPTRTSVSSAVVEAACPGAKSAASATSTLTKTVSDHGDSPVLEPADADGWQKFKSDEAEVATTSADAEFKKPNSILNQDGDRKFVKITMKIPGLKVRFLTHSPSNGRLVSAVYNRNRVSMTFVLNEKRSDARTYKYESREPLKMNVSEKGSYFKVSHSLHY
jgi:hypothetical protein